MASLLKTYEAPGPVSQMEQLGGAHAGSYVVPEVSSGILPQAELLHAVDQRSPADVQVLGRLRLVPVELLQRFQDQFLLDAFQTDAVGRQFELDGVLRRPSGAAGNPAGR